MSGIYLGRYKRDNKVNRDPVGSGERATAAARRAAERRSAIRWGLIVVLLLAGMAALAQLPVALEAGGRMAGTLSLLRAAMSPVLSDQAATSTTVETGVEARARAVLAGRSGRERAVEEILAAALQADPNDGLTRFELCRFYAGQARWEDARGTCANTAESVEYWLQAGVRALDAQQPDEAIEWFRLAIATKPDESEGWRQLARTMLANKRHVEAIPAFEQVMALEETPPFDVFNALGTAYLAASEWEKAQETARRGLLIYPDHRELYLIVGESLRRQGDLEAAESWYGDWLQQWPNDAYALGQLGEIAMQREQPNEAIRFFQQATVAAPDAFGYWLNLGRAAGLAGNTTLATAAYDKALSLRPNDAAIWLDAGRYLTQINETERARAVFEHVLAIQPDNGEAAAELAELASDSATP